MKDEEIDMITDLVLNKLKNDNEVEKLKKEIISLEDKLSFARNMAIKKSKECEELKETIEELKKDKEWFSDRLDEQIEATLKLMNENNELKENNLDSKLIESYRKERELIFNDWRDNVITAKSIINEFVGFMYVNILFHDEILKMISSKAGEISIEILKEYIEKGKKFLAKELPCL